MTTPHLRIRLRECMDTYEARTGTRVSYGDIAEATGLSLATVQSIGSRGYYNATLRVVAQLCVTLHVSPGELLELRETLNDATPEQVTQDNPHR